MSISEAKKKANRKWDDENMKERFDELKVRVPKGKKAEIKAFAGERGKTLNSFVNEAVDEKMQRDSKG